MALAISRRIPAPFLPESLELRWDIRAHSRLYCRDFTYIGIYNTSCVCAYYYYVDSKYRGMWVLLCVRYIYYRYKRAYNTLCRKITQNQHSCSDPQCNWFKQTIMQYIPTRFSFRLRLEKLRFNNEWKWKRHHRREGIKETTSARRSQDDARERV